MTDDVSFTQCRACGCTCIDARPGLLNPQASPLGIYNRDGSIVTEPGRKGHALHRCPPRKAS